MNIRIRKKYILVWFAFLIFVFVSIILLRNSDSSAPTMSGQAGTNVNLLAIFLTGLLTGGLTCLAVQGGLLAATIAQREEEKLKKNTQQTGNALPILAFLVAKLAAYTLLGFLLGWFGSLFQLSLIAQILMQIAVALFMVGTALNILNVHPIFRYFVIQPPRSLTRLVRKQSKNKSLFAPLLLGAFTIFIPCGTTQAMMALSIGSSSPVLGAAVLFAFVLGTSPLFFTLGYFATRLGETLHRRFMKVAAFALIIVAFFNLNNVLALTGSPWTVNNLIARSPVTSSSGNTKPTQNAVITITSGGYSPNSLNVKAGSQVTLKIYNQGSYSCASAFTIPYFNYQKIVQAGQTEIISLAMPEKPTQIPFMCSMGMYRGVINVL